MQKRYLKLFRPFSSKSDKSRCRGSNQERKTYVNIQRVSLSIVKQKRFLSTTFKTIVWGHSMFQIILLAALNTLTISITKVITPMQRGVFIMKDLTLRASSRQTSPINCILSIVPPGIIWILQKQKYECHIKILGCIIAILNKYIHIP